MRVDFGREEDITGERRTIEQAQAIQEYICRTTGEFIAKQAAETEAFWARQGCQALSTEQISNEQLTAMLTRPV